MKKIILILTMFLLFISYASAQEVEINDVVFKIPENYSDGELKNDCYRLDNIFSIRCIDDDVADSIGLWASEKDYVNNSNIGSHPVRHFYQYNKYVHGNDSHAYFASGKSVYEIHWVGSQITPDIKNLIINTPPSKINDDDFYNALDESLRLYKQNRIDKLNKESEYNYMEAKYHSQSQNKDKRFNELLITYYNNRK